MARLPVISVRDANDARTVVGPRSIAGDGSGVPWDWLAHHPP
jgi:hypothetical protein